MRPASCSSARRTISTGHCGSSATVASVRRQLRRRQTQRRSASDSSGRSMRRCATLWSRWRGMRSPRRATWGARRRRRTTRRSWRDARRRFSGRSVVVGVEIVDRLATVTTTDSLTTDETRRHILTTIPHPSLLTTAAQRGRRQVRCCARAVRRMEDTGRSGQDGARPSAQG